MKASDAPFVKAKDLPFKTVSARSLLFEKPPFKDLFFEETRKAKEDFTSRLGELGTAKGLGSAMLQGPILTGLGLATKAANILPPFAATRALRRQTEQIPEAMASRGLPGGVPLGVGARIATEMLPTGGPEELAFQVLGGPTSGAAKNVLAKMPLAMEKHLPRVLNGLANLFATFASTKGNIIKENMLSGGTSVIKYLTDPRMLDDLFRDTTKGLKSVYSKLGGRIDKLALLHRSRTKFDPIIDVDEIRIQAERVLKKYTDIELSQLKPVLNNLRVINTAEQRAFDTLSKKSVATFRKIAETGEASKIDLFHLTEELKSSGYENFSFDVTKYPKGYKTDPLVKKLYDFDKPPKTPQYRYDLLALKDFYEKASGADITSALQMRRDLQSMLSFGIPDDSGFDIPIKIGPVRTKINSLIHALNDKLTIATKNWFGDDSFIDANKTFSDFATASSQFNEIMGKEGHQFGKTFLSDLREGGQAFKDTEGVFKRLEEFGDLSSEILANREKELAAEPFISTNRFALLPSQAKKEGIFSTLKKAGVTKELSPLLTTQPKTGFLAGILGLGGGYASGGIGRAVAGGALGLASTSPRLGSIVSRELIQQQMARKLLGLLEKSPTTRAMGQAAFLETKRKSP